MAQTNTTIEVPAIRSDDSGVQKGAKASHLVSLTAMFCGVLRNSARFSWLDREVYNQTLVLQQVLVDLAKEKPVSLRFTPEGLRLGDEVLENPPKAARQFHAMARRKSIQELVFSCETSVGEVMILLRLLQNKSSIVYL